jgi:O-succinylbenzoic acid--CoA ligase
VVLSRRAFAASARATEANLGWRADDRWLLSLPVAHVGGLSVVTRCLLARRAVVLGPPPGLTPRAIEALIETIERDRVTLLSLVPAQLQALLDREPAWRPPAAVRAAILGGGPAAPALRRRARERGWPILASYGLTEACSQVATQSPAEGGGDDESCGRPLQGIELRIRDGALEVRGPVLMSGYYPPGASPLTSDGWHPTRDRARLDAAGRLRILGRSDAAILCGGETIQPEEVEGVLEACTGVARACVFGLPDPLRGEVVAAAVVARPGSVLEPGSLAREWSSRLAPYRRPRQLAILAELPATPTGKLDRRRAREAAEPALQPIPR